NPLSDQDLHDAPTAVSVPLGEDPATAIGGEIPIPVETHPTQTALTAPGISLRKGGPGRVAFVLAAGALVAGIIGVIAAFARGPDAPAKTTAARTASAIPPAAAHGTAPAAASATESRPAGWSSANERGTRT